MSDDGLNNEKLLLERIANGDALAFRQFFDLYRVRLYVFVEQLIHSKADRKGILGYLMLMVKLNAIHITEQ